MKQTIEDLCLEIPQCNISLEVVLSQKVKMIVARAKDLEETIENMDAQHKARITELEARALGTPHEEHEARVLEMRNCATTIETRLVETHKLLDEATETWTTMDGIDGLNEVHGALHKNQIELNALTMIMKDLISLQRMLKMRESNKL